MITNIRSVNTSIPSQKYDFCTSVVLTLKIYSLNSFQVYNSVLSIMVTKLCIRSSSPIGEFIPLDQHLPWPLATTILVYFYRFGFFRFHI